jgi:hypothetical protein
MKSTSVILVLAFGGLLLGACGKKDGAAGDAPSASAPVTAAPVASETAAPVETATAAPTPTPVVTTPKVQENIDACCNALQGEAKSGKGTAKAAAARALTICPGVAKLVREGKTTRASGLTQIRSALVGTSVPSQCQ